MENMKTERTEKIEALQQEIKTSSNWAYTYGVKTRCLMLAVRHALAGGREQMGYDQISSALYTADELLQQARLAFTKGKEFVDRLAVATEKLHDLENPGRRKDPRPE